MAEEVQSRRIRRRSRSSGLSDSTVSESMNLNSDVENRASSPVSAPLSEAESNVGSSTDAPADFTPASKERSRVSQYEREYRLKLLHRLIMRNVPLDQMAKELDVSISTIIRDRKELYRRLREAAQNLDVNELIGDTLGFYTEIQAMGLRAASVHKAPLNMRLAAMRTALAAKNDMHRFLNSVGVYDVLRYRVQDGDATSDIEKLVSITETILSGEAESKDDLQSIAGLGFEEEDEEIELLR